MKLCGKRDLEEHILHHESPVALGELKRVALEQHILKSPYGCGQPRRIAHLAAQTVERQPHAAAGRIAGRPALARPGIRGVAISAKCTAVYPRIGYRIDHFLA